ncbi:MAG: AraC family transcriptional regulator [Bacteroidaceae bacterium]|nr:AraC family transcriptional regulator [Bacteroidaceae bacterium]MBQ9176215.1 AraC family transcriptional regulator [Bacteroidaceae bacterium]MBR1379445.1 AraC family transcriptional regulator [Bacteroidaceae bacterium]
MLRKIDFKDFPTDSRFPQIEGQLFMADNIDEPIEHRSSMGGMDAPVQLGMTLILLCIEGSMHLKINLYQYRLESNMAATLLAGSFMQILETSDNFCGAVIAIAKDFMNFGEDVKTGMAALRHTSEMPCFTMTPDTLKETLGIYRMMRQKLSDSSLRYRPQMARAFLDLLKYNGLQHFAEMYDNDMQHQTPNRRVELTQQFMAAVSEHYRQERQVTFYADRLCVSPKYLSTVVHKVSGKYATEWIRDFVLLDAKAMLRNSTRTIKEICAQLGFPNQSMFTKFFKQYTGCTPKQYRNERTNASNSLYL